MKTGIELIAEERHRQVDKEGWTSEHDASHINGSLAQAAACYALDNGIAHGARYVRCGCREAMCGHSNYESFKVMVPWPWEEKWDKRKQHDRVKQLIIAGALIAAEIDRINVIKK